MNILFIVLKDQLIYVLPIFEMTKEFKVLKKGSINLLTRYLSCVSPFDTNY